MVSVLRNAKNPFIHPLFKSWRAFGESDLQVTYSSAVRSLPRGIIKAHESQ